MRLLQQIAAVHVVITVQARSSGESALSARCAVPVLLHCTLPWRKDAARCGPDKPQMLPAFSVLQSMTWSAEVISHDLAIHRVSPLTAAASTSRPAPGP